MRYIDADELYKKLYPLDLADKRKYTINAKAVADAIANIPTADVVPKSESLPLDVHEALKQRAIEKAKAEVAREIFAGIEDCMKSFEDDDDGYLLKKCEFEFFMRELKKEYTEEKL